MGDFLCGICDLLFKTNFNLSRHIDIVHGQCSKHTCTICGRSYNRADNLRKHTKKAHPPTEPTTLPTDQVITATEQPMRIQTKQETTKPAHTSCTRETDQVNPSKQGTSTKRKKADSLSNNKRHKQILTDELGTLETLPDDVMQTYTENWDSIQTHANIHEYLSTYTFFHSPQAIHPIDLDTTLVDTIFKTQTKRFKINYSHHLILRHKETQELRFFHASDNNAHVLDYPLLVNNRDDFETFLATLRETNILDTALHNIPNTEYTVETVPATSFYLYHLNAFPIG